MYITTSDVVPLQTVTWCLSSQYGGGFAASMVMPLPPEMWCIAASKVGHSQGTGALQPVLWYHCSQSFDPITESCSLLQQVHVVLFICYLHQFLCYLNQFCAIYRHCSHFVWCHSRQFFWFYFQPIQPVLGATYYLYFSHFSVLF